MRVLLSTYDSRGGVEPMAALAVQLQVFGAEAVVCAPPDCAGRLAEIGVPLVPTGAPGRPLVHGAAPPSMADVSRRMDEIIATWFDQVPAVAEDCDAVVASGLPPAVGAARSVADQLGLPSAVVHFCPISCRHRITARRRCPAGPSRPA